MKILAQLEKDFSENEILEILEAGRIALTDSEINEYVLDAMDLADEPARRLGDKLTKVMGPQA